MRKTNFTCCIYEKIKDVGRCCLLLLLLLTCTHFDTSAQTVQPGDEILFQDGQTVTISAQQMNCTDMSYPFFDAGGVGAPYSDEGVTQVFTICPENVMNQTLTIEFTDFLMTQGGTLSVYDGATPTGTPTLITAPTSVTSGFDGRTDRTSCLTFELGGQDEISNEEGWKANVLSTEFANAVSISTTGVNDIENCDAPISQLNLTPDYDCGTVGNAAYLQQVQVGNVAVPFLVSGQDVNGDGIFDNNDTYPATGAMVAATPADIILLGTQPGTDGILGTADDIPAALSVGTNEVCLVIGYDLNGNNQLEATEEKARDCTFVNVETRSPIACNDELNVGLDSDCGVTISPDVLLEATCADESAYVISLTLVQAASNFMDPQDLEQDGQLGFQGGNNQTGIVANNTNAVLVQVPGRYRYNIKLANNTCWGFINLEDKSAPVCMPAGEEETRVSYDVNCDGRVEGRANDPSGVDDLMDEYILCSLVEQNGIEIYFDELEARDAAFDLDGDGNEPYNADGSVNDIDDLVVDCDGDGINESSVCGDFLDCTGIASIYSLDEVVDVCETNDLQGIAIDETRFDLASFEIMRVHSRTWFAIDKNGITSQQGCTQRVFVMRPKAATVVLPQEVEIDCTEDVAGIEQLSSPRFTVNNRIFNNGTGSDGPRAYNTDRDNSTPAIPAATKPYFLSAGVNSCQYAASYHEDPVIDVCTGSTKQIRHWSVIDWCDGQQVYSDFAQLIKVTDNTAPTIISENGFPLFVDNVGVLREDRATAGTPAYSINLGLQLFDCDAEGNLPDFSLTDDCSEVEFTRVSIERVVDENTHTAGEIFINNFLSTQPVNGELTSLNLPSGQYIVTYFFTDDCGNANEVRVPMFFEDNRVPQPICNDEIVVTLVPTGTEGDQRARIYPAQISNTSRDACFPLIYQVRKGDGSNQAWGDFVEFNCSDVTTSDEDATLRVELRVTEDRNNNFRIDAGELSNTCWTYVRIEDKTTPLIAVEDKDFICDDPEISQLQLQAGNYTPNADNTDALFPTILGGCSSAGIVIQLIETDLQAYDPICRIGTFTRRFRAVRNIHGNEIASPDVLQTVSVFYNADWTMKFPTDILLVCGDETESNLDVIPEPLKVEDIITNRGCDSWGMEVEDEIFDIVGQDGDGACFKIVRTYKFINWCTWDPTNSEVAVVPRPIDFFVNPLLAVTLDYQSDPVLDICALQNNVDDRFERENDPYDLKIGNDGDSVVEFDDNSGLYETDADWIYLDENIGGIFGGSNTTSDINNAGDCIDNNFNALVDSAVDVDNSTPANALIDDGQIHTFVSAEAYGSFIYRQVIKVSDLEAPIVDAIDDFVVCDSTNANDNCTVDVTFPIPSVTECRPTYSISWELFAFEGEIATVSGRLNGDNNGNFTPLTLNQIPYGTHLFRYLVSDGCGNFTATDFRFTAQDCKAPTAYCVAGINLELMPGGMVEVWASDLDAGSFDDCSEPVRLSFSPNPADTGRVFGCNQRGTNFVRLWVTDAAGNQSNCETIVIIQDNDRDCQGGAAISGTIQNASGENVEAVSIRLNGSANNTITSDVNGYLFTGLEIGADYTLTPEKDLDPYNGISTFDLVLMRKHIIGVTPLDSPYRMIAADVNSSGSVTTLDMVQLRRMILGEISTFTNNTSWRFVDASYVFPDANNPWEEAFPEVVNFNNIEEGVQHRANFIAIKIGDVNESAIPSNLLGTEERSQPTEQLVFQVEQASAGADETVTLDFYADMTAIDGYQFTLNFNAEQLELLEIVEGVATAEHFGTRQAASGVVTTSFDGVVNNGERLFSLTFATSNNADVSQLLEVSSEVTNAEAYRGTELLGVALNFSQSTLSVGYDLYQNTPNPFYGNTRIGFHLPVAADATLTVRDLNGKIVHITTGHFDAGTHQVDLNSEQTKANSAILYYTLETADFSATRKMIVIR